MWAATGVKTKLTGMEASEHLRLARLPFIDEDEDEDDDTIFSRRGKRKSKQSTKRDLTRYGTRCFVNLVYVLTITELLF